MCHIDAFFDMSGHGILTYFFECYFNIFFKVIITYLYFNIFVMLF